MAVKAALVWPMTACAGPKVTCMALTVIPTVCPVLSLIGVCWFSTTVPAVRCSLVFGAGCTGIGVPSMLTPVNVADPLMVTVLLVPVVDAVAVSLIDPEVVTPGCPPDKVLAAWACWLPSALRVPLAVVAVSGALPVTVRGLLVQARLAGAVGPAVSLPRRVLTP